MTRDVGDIERDEELAKLLARWSAPIVPDGMDERVLAAYRRQAGTAEPWWARLFTASVRVPLPVAVGLLMLFIVTAALALRPGTAPSTAGTAGPSEPVQAAQQRGPARGHADEPGGIRARPRGHGHGAGRAEGDAAMRIAAAVTFLAAWGATAAAQTGEGVALATLENGASIGFALVRTGAQGPGGAIGEAALPRSNSVSRVLWDRESGAYFGYRVEVERRAGARPFRVVFKPLDRGAVERELKQRNNCPSCPAPSPLGNAGAAVPARAAARRGRGAHAASCSPTRRPASASSTWSSCR